MIQGNGVGIVLGDLDRFSVVVCDFPLFFDVALSLVVAHVHLVALADNDIDSKICCHGFLWSMCDEVPELGIAVCDAWHGRGLAKHMLTLLEKVCLAEKKPAIELTTMQDNERAHSVYLKAGYEDLGIIRNPLGVDVNAALPRGVSVLTAVRQMPSFVSNDRNQLTN